ncbi:MAG TPA: hypothetical protein VK890_05235, partial [Bacteroidia bacterium]|nr:hypothetical protein [Bacteroidia bacterium]
GFAFGLELGVRYRIIPRLSVMLVADYFTANAAYQFVTTGQSTDSSGNTTDLPEQVGPAHQNFTVINLNLGVGWTF